MYVSPRASVVFNVSNYKNILSVAAGLFVVPAANKLSARKSIAISIEPRVPVVVAHHYVALFVPTMSRLPSWSVVLKRFNTTGFTYLTQLEHPCYYYAMLIIYAMWDKAMPRTCLTVTMCSRSHLNPASLSSALSSELADVPSSIWNMLYYFFFFFFFTITLDVCAVWRLLVNMLHGSLWI